VLSCSVSVERRGDAEAWLRRLIAATKGPSQVDMGLIPGQAPADVIAYGWYNHEGTSRGIPSRPFARVAFHRAESGFRTEIRGTLRGVLHGQATYATALPRLGQRGVTAIQGVIDSNLGPALKPSTVARKGSSRTLIDKGRLRAAQSFKVR
jgi:hypothetical protein